MGIVLPGLSSYQRLVHVLEAEHAVAHVEFTYHAPLYRRTPQIVERLAAGPSAIEKFDAYFECAVLDEDERSAVAAEFRADYLRRYPRSEASDVFAASGEILGFSIALRAPLQLDEPDAALAVVLDHPHDRASVAAMTAREPVPEAHLRASLKLFFEDVYNARRRKNVEVEVAMTGARRKDPVVIELHTDGAIPGYFVYVLEPIIDEVDGALVFLPG